MSVCPLITENKYFKMEDPVLSVRRGIPFVISTVVQAPFGICVLAGNKCYWFIHKTIIRMCQNVRLGAASPR